MRKVLFITIGMLAAAAVHAQDINFSQFYELPLLRNPALAGDFRGDIRVTSAFRNQWSSVTVPYQTQALGVELKLGGRNSDTYGSLGMQITNDVAGDSKLGKTQLFPMVAIHIPVSANRNNYFTAGFLGGAVQQRFDPSKLTFDDQFVNGAYSATNPTRQVFNNTNVLYWDLAMGVKLSGEMGVDTRYFIGGGWFHLFKPKVAFEPSSDVRLNHKYVVNAGLSLPTSDFDRVILYFDYFMQGGYNQGQGGFLYKHDFLQEDQDYTFSMAGGLFYRLNDAVVPVIKIDYYNWSAGFTYDVNVSKLVKASQSRGGFELTLSYSNFLNILNSSLNKTKCPVNVY